MDITGKIINILPIESGTSARGEWRKQSFILETEEQYPKKVCIMMWGNKIDEFALNEGEKITASINVESREFNGKWYTDVRAWKVSRSQSQPAVAANNQMPEPPAFATDAAPLPGEDDLPF